MPKPESCSICGKPTRKFLFNDRTLGVHVCSRKCEYAYLKELVPNTKEQARVLTYLDQMILSYRKYARMAWTISGLGVVGLVLAFVFVSPLSFIAGGAVCTVGVFSSRYFEIKMYEISKTRKRIEI